MEIQHTQTREQDQRKQQRASKQHSITASLSQWIERVQEGKLTQRQWWGLTHFATALAYQSFLFLTTITLAINSVTAPKSLMLTSRTRYGACAASMPRKEARA